MFSAPALTVSRLGLVFAAAALLADNCSISPMATIGLAAQQTAGPAASVDASSTRPIDRGEMRPYAIRVSGKYYVRIGAFDERAAAEEFAAKLRRVTTEPLDVAEFGVGAGRSAVRLYRVVIGPAASRNGVVELIAALEAKGYGVTRAPRTAASNAEPATSPGGSESPQRAVGPDLVEVFVDSVEEETTAAQAVTPRPRAIPAPAREREVATAGQAPPPERADPGATADVSAIDADVAASAGDAMAEQRGITPPQAAAYAPKRRVQPFMVSKDGRRFLQVGAYAVRTTAEILASQLRQVTSEPVFVAEVVDDNGRSLHRVRIGPIESDASLAALADALGPNHETGWALPAASSADSTALTLSPRSTPSTKARGTRTAFVVLRDSERFVQVGAYSARSMADALASELRHEIDVDVGVTEVIPESGGPVYRVRIGPVAGDSLIALVGALESLGYVVD